MAGLKHTLLLLKKNLPEESSATVFDNFIRNFLDILCFIVDRILQQQQQPAKGNIQINLFLLILLLLLLPRFYEIKLPFSQLSTLLFISLTLKR